MEISGDKGGFVKQWQWLWMLHWMIESPYKTKQQRDLSMHEEIDLDVDKLNYLFIPWEGSSTMQELEYHTYYNLLHLTALMFFFYKL